MWVKHIYPAFKKLIKNKSEKNIIKSLEKNNIINSLNNLHHYPDIKEKISNNKLEIFGLWFDIGSGKLLKFNKDNNKFEKITY